MNLAFEEDAVTSHEVPGYLSRRSEQSLLGGPPASAPRRQTALDARPRRSPAGLSSGVAVGLIKPKVLYVIGQLRRGGAEQQLYYLLKHLRPSALVVALSEGGFWAAPIRELGIDVIELPRRGRFDFARLRALTKITRAYKPDIIHIFLDNVPGLYGRLAALCAGNLRVVAGERAEAALQQPLWYRTLKRALNKAVVSVVSNSRANYEYLLRRRIAPTNKLSCIPNGLELDLFTRKVGPKRIAERASNGDRDLLVGTVGSLSTVKSPEVFLRCAARVLEQHKDVKFIHVGDGPLRADMEALASKLGIQGRLRFAGYCQDIPHQLSQMDLFVLTSRTEGLPNAVMEAMAAGLPCVVTDAGGCRELVRNGETGYLVPIGDEKALAERIGMLLRDERLRRTMGQRGREEMQQFDACRMADQYGELYLKILASRVN